MAHAQRRREYTIMIDHILAGIVRPRVPRPTSQRVPDSLHVTLHCCTTQRRRRRYWGGDVVRRGLGCCFCRCCCFVVQIILWELPPCATAQQQQYTINTRARHSFDSVWSMHGVPCACTQQHGSPSITLTKLTHHPSSPSVRPSVHSDVCACDVSDPLLSRAVRQIPCDHLMILLRGAIYMIFIRLGACALSLWMNMGLRRRWLFVVACANTFGPQTAVFCCVQLLILQLLLLCCYICGTIQSYIYICICRYIHFVQV